jgi:HK97 family phage major capsid protein
MTKIDELTREIEELKDKAFNLKEEDKIDEALKIVDIFQAKQAEVKKLETLENALKEGVKVVENKVVENKELINKEEKVFADYVRAGVANAMTAGDNGVLIPSTIADRIIARVEEISPIFARATKFYVKGELVFLAENTSCTVTLIDELEEGGEGSKPTFKTVKLTGYVARALSKISRSLINKSQFDIVTYVVNDIAEELSKFVEKTLINGIDTKIVGLSKVVPTEVATINADTYVDLQMAVPSTLQAKCEWLMNPADLKVARKFKTTDGQYLLNADVTKEFGWEILGKNVLISDNVPAGKVFYGDFSGLYVKLENNFEVSVLNERYSEQFVVGILGFVQFDGAVVESQKIVAMTKGE